MLDTTITMMAVDVKFNLGNRSNIDTQINQWIRDAYREIGNNFPLETLEISLDSVMSAGTYIYDYPSDGRAIKSISIQSDITNQAGPIELVMKDIRYLQRYPLNQTGIPSLWAPFNRQIHVRMSPADAYPLALKYWQFVSIDPNTLGDTVLMVPDDWLEVIQYEATRRGFIALKQYMDAQALHMLLHGDPKNPGDPGLIKRKLTQNAAESAISDYAISPKIRRYTF